MTQLDHEVLSFDVQTTGTKASIVQLPENLRAYVPFSNEDEERASLRIVVVQQ
jgi:hypothetical protein